MIKNEMLDEDFMSEAIYEDEGSVVYEGFKAGSGAILFRVVRNEQIDSRRWVSVHNFIVESDGRFYQTLYERGLTEYQETSPFENGLEWTEMVAVEVITTKYIKKV